jgi:SAM-dependent methyltransferase
MNAGRRWAEGLRALAIPDAILATAPEPRRGPDPAVFRLRTEAALRAPLSASHRRALDALPKDGSVLDVGVGAGAASLPLASRAYLIVGIDRSETMLSEFRRCAQQASVRVLKPRAQRLLAECLLHLSLASSALGPSGRTMPWNLSQSRRLCLPPGRAVLWSRSPAAILRPG